MLSRRILVAAIPLTTDLYGDARDISAVTYTPIPLLIVASLWYLLFTSLLMVGQYFLEKRFSRGVNARRPDRNESALATGALNPMAAVVDGFRWALLGVETLRLGPLLGGALVTALALTGGLVFFRRTEATFADVI